MIFKNSKKFRGTPENLSRHSTQFENHCSILYFGSTGSFFFIAYLFNLGCSWTTCSHAWADKQK